MSRLILIANPGSASKKYALFEDLILRAKLHFEWENGVIVCTLIQPKHKTHLPTSFTRLEDIPPRILEFCQTHALLHANETITGIGLRVVAPGSYFLADRKVDNEFIDNLEQAKQQAPLHIQATLDELTALPSYTFPIFGISDSQFHSTKPDYAWNYGLPLEMTDTYELKRFGYHGLSVASVLKTKNLPSKVIVCHIGSGVSVTAVKDGESIDTTMGYSPLEGAIMGTRSGSIDPSLLPILKNITRKSDSELESFLNHESGLYGLGGSADIRELLKQQADGNHQAMLALQTFTYSITKAVGAMASALNGVDAIIITGTAGERAPKLREAIVRPLAYLGFTLDSTANSDLTLPRTATLISASAKPIFVIPTEEETEIARRISQLL